METKANKYEYLLVIQQNNGYGWEDVSEYEATSSGKAIELCDKLTSTGKKQSLFKHDLNEYIFSRTGATRSIFRKELKNI